MQIQEKKNTKMKTIDMVYAALFAVLIAVCAWVTFPIGTIPLTMQTFGISCTLGLLGGRRGSMAVLVYILLGAIGAPVFAGFGGGIGVLLNTTGGYILGFLAEALVYWLVTGLCCNRLWSQAVGMLAGLLACYMFGTAWFMVLYARTSGPIGLATALGWCVLPYILPDLIKITLALGMTRLLGRRIPAFRPAA